VRYRDFRIEIATMHETCSPENIVAKLEEGVRVIAGHLEETPKIGRAHQRRTMPA
jgi:hypothetical protein